MTETHELEEMTQAEAYEQLDEEEFKKWEKIQDLKSQAEENRTELEKQYEEAFDVLVNKEEESLVKEISFLGNEIKYLFSMNRKQEKLFNQIKKLEQIEEPNEEDFEKYRDALFEFFGDIVVEFNGKKIKEQDWSGKDLAEYCYNEWGRVGFQEFIEDIVIGFYEEKQEKLEAVKKFR